MIYLAFFVMLLLFGIGIWRSLDLQNEKLHPTKGLPWYLVGLTLFTIAWSATTVDAGSIGVVKRFGKATRQLTPGLNFVLPYAETVDTVATQTRIIKPNEDAASKDLQIVHTEVTLAYHVDPTYAMDILVNLNNDAENRVIQPALFEAIKAVTAQYTVQELIEQRAMVRDRIEELVVSRLAPYHIIPETTSITSFKFSDQYEAAIEAKVVAQQNAEKAQNELNQVKIDAQQQVAQATAAAEARVAQAKAEAQSLALQRTQLTPELLQLRTIEMLKEKWDGQLPQTIIGGNGAIPMLDVLKASQQARSKPE